MRNELEDAAQAWGDRHGRMAALRALCDTVVPAVRPPAGADGALAGFFARRASDLATDVAVAGYVASRLAPGDAAGIGQLLDLLARTGFPALPLPARTAALRALRGLSGDVADGLDGLRALTLVLHYALPGPDGSNPSWEALGYPGPPAVAVQPGPRLPTAVPDDGVLDADVVVVGSGAGGGVVAGVLAGHGLDVVVLEAGGHHEEADFPPDELTALDRLYWRGGYQRTADGTMTVVAGATLGGGTTVNWTNCVLPPGWVRDEWAAAGLADVATAAFDAHVQAVLTRIGATTACSDANGPNSRLAEGAKALGWSWYPTRRNADPDRYDPGSAGHLGFGDRSGSKQSTVKTYLADAAAAGARILVRTRARRVLVERGRAAGVAAEVARPDGSVAPLTVRARTVVVACGALETPALLLRSGIGGPAVGRHLHLHPVVAVAAFYDERQRSWEGAPMTVVVDEHADLTERHGFLVEVPHFGIGLAAATLPWRSGRDHKLLLGRSDRIATSIGQVRDRGWGRVSLDGAGEARVTYPLADPLDLGHLRQALAAMARLHEAAGARAVLDLHPARRLWRRGTDLQAFLADVTARPFGGRDGRPVFSAHQMGTARMGADPATSAADPEGQLHTTPGVWVGDASAFPTASGANPMVSIMALAHRTASALLAARPA